MNEVTFFITRLMFFSDNGPNPRIEKASLDGEDRVTIVYKGLSRVLSLTVDTANKKLYWADVQRHTIEGSSYDGSNRRVIRRLNLWSVTGVAYHQVPINSWFNSFFLLFIAVIECKITSSNKIFINLGSRTIIIKEYVITCTNSNYFKLKQSYL